MSHLSKIKTVIKDKDSFIAALEACGYEYQLDTTIEMGYRLDGAHSVPAVVAFNPVGSRAKNFMGLVVNDAGEFEVIGDDYGTGCNFKKVSNKVVQSYAETEVQKQFSMSPDLLKFGLISNTVLEDGTIQLLYQAY